MIATYKAYLSRGNRVNWLGAAPKPNSAKTPVLVMFLEDLAPFADDAKELTGRSATLAAMEDARLGRKLSRPFKSAEEMIVDMLKDD